MKKKALSLLFVFSLVTLLTSCTQTSTSSVSFVPQGELLERIKQNLNRLESKKYQPENVFLTEEQSKGWPGDTEGRTILGLVCDSKAGNIHTDNLAKIVNLIPEHLNEKGYMGIDYGEIIDEQQISGNGWMLRGLCAYYDYTGDKAALDMIRSISYNLFVKHAGKYKNYPISESERSGDGGAAGRIANQVREWRLSSDIGCLFVGLDGLIDAWRIIGGDEMRKVIDEMIARFLEVDCIKIKSQIHSTLTGCRALVRFAELTDEKHYISEVEKRWDLYKKYGMTENYANYNWFRRYNTWTEPCAIVDSYLLALKLWEHTGQVKYLEDAHLIWYNAICHAQRANGGFGCDACPGEASGPDLRVKIDEADYCCTMRGAEGLATAVNSLAYYRDGCIYLTGFHEGILHINETQLKISSDYPFSGKFELEVLQGQIKAEQMKIFIPYWMKTDTQIQLEDGFMVLKEKLRKGDKLVVSYSFELREEPCLNIENTSENVIRKFSGPLILDEFEKPIYHIMNTEVNKASGYHRRILHQK